MAVTVFCVVTRLADAVLEEATGARAKRFEVQWAIVTACVEVAIRHRSEPDEGNDFWWGADYMRREMKAEFPDRMYKVCAGCDEHWFECWCQHDCPCGCGSEVWVNKALPDLHGHCPHRIKKNSAFGPKLRVT